MLSDDRKVFITDGDELTSIDAKYKNDHPFTGTFYIVIMTAVKPLPLGMGSVNEKNKIIKAYAVEGSEETQDLEPVLTIKSGSTTVYEEKAATNPGFGEAQGSFLVNLADLNHTFGLGGGATKTGAWACIRVSNNCNSSGTTNMSGVAAAGTYNWTIVQNGSTLVSGSSTVTVP